MHTQRLPVHDPGGLGVFELMATAFMGPTWPAGRSSGRDERIAKAIPSAVQAPRLSLLQRLERWFRVRQQRDLEDYLAQSADVHELEMRIRMIERRGLHAYY